MSWFKKIANRFFGPDAEEEKSYENYYVEQEEIKETPVIEKSPSFRFPIITDAEIYGWNEEDVGEQARRPVEPAVDHKDDEDYETVPLYKNERWPEEPATGKIHRAGSSSLKYRSSTSPEKKSPAVPQPEPQAAPAKTGVKRTGRPFSPTEVPSPIFGYAKPNKIEYQKLKDHEDETLVTETKFAKTEALEDVAFVSPIEPIAAKEEVSADVENLARIDETEMEHTTENKITVPTIFNPKEPSVAIATPGEQAGEGFEKLEHEGFLEHHDEVEETELNSDFEADAIPQSEPDEALPQLEEEQNSLESLQFEPSNETNDDVESVEKCHNPSLDFSDQLNDFAEEETKSAKPIEQAPQNERIVPFNVLMLKSDKEKLEKAFQSVSNQTAAIQREQPALSDRAEQQSVQMQVSPEEPEVVAEIMQMEEALIAEEIMDTEETPPLVEETVETEEEPPYYAFPSLDSLIPPEDQVDDEEWLESQSEKLEVALSHFSVQANVIEAVQGPSVTRFELTVAQGTKVSKVRNLADDLKLALAAEDIRIQAPIPGRSSIGIEIPNRKTRPVRISEVIGSIEYQASTSPLEAALGLGLTGTPVTIDLRKMPHGMIAGATGSGKSVCINSILISLLFKASPTDLKMMLIDPKMVELAPFNGIPHLISPVITDVKAATAALKWAVAEMERRYELLAHAGVRDIERYNQQVMEHRKFSLKMPYLLIVIDELADLMMMAPADVEVSISRIAQKARACGIHLIIATQRPSVDVITGTIKANVPTRIAFSVSSQIDSRTILDSPGAERLLGKGDMLYIGNGQSSAVRLQGTFVTDDEIERIIEHVRNEAEPNYLFGQEDLLAHAADEEEKDPLYEEACHFILEQGTASTSLLQRNFSIGYNRAAKLIDRMEKQGFISGQRGSKARDVYLTEKDLDKIYKE